MRKLDHGPAAPKIARPSIHPNPSSRFRRTSIAPPTDDSQITQHRIPTLKSDRLLAHNIRQAEDFMQVGIQRFSTQLIGSAILLATVVLALATISILDQSPAYFGAAATEHHDQAPHDSAPHGHLTNFCHASGCTSFGVPTDLIAVRSLRRVFQGFPALKLLLSGNRPQRRSTDSPNGALNIRRESSAG